MAPPVEQPRSASTRHGI